MNIAIRNNPPRDNLIVDDASDDDERDSLSALLLVLPPECCADDEESERIRSGDLVSVIMVGRGDLFMRRVRDYQQRHAQAMAEWNAWDEADEEARGGWVKWSDAHDTKLNELCDKYDLGEFSACDETRFRIVEVTQPSLI